MRTLRPPPRPGWPVAVELHERGGAVAILPSGQRRRFPLESDLLAAYGWTWADLRAWAEEGQGEGWYREAAPPTPSSPAWSRVVDWWARWRG